MTLTTVVQTGPVPSHLTVGQLSNMTMMAFYSQQEVRGQDVASVIEKLAKAFEVPWYVVAQATAEVHSRLGDRLKTP